MSKMTGCLIKLLLQLPNILKTNGDYNQNLVSIRKNFLLSGVSSECKDLSLLKTQTLIFLGRN